MSRLVCVTNDEGEWLESRRQGIGASDAAAILGVSPYTSAFALYHQKLGLQPASWHESDLLYWGRVLEAPIAARYARETSRPVHPVAAGAAFTLHRSDEHAFALASLDRWTEIEDRRVPLELKNAGAWKRDEWTDGDAPLHFLVQCQHQMLVTGTERASLAALIGGHEFRWLDIERNDRFIAQLLDAEAAFWDRVTRQDPPPVDGSEATASLLAEIYPRDDGHTIALPDEALVWDQARLEAIETIKAAEVKRTEAENKICAALGTATKGIVASGVAYSWKTQQRKAYSVKETAFRVLRRIKI